MTHAKSSAPAMISSARDRPARAVSHSVAPPPGTTAQPTSICAKIAFSRLTKRISQARASSLPCPRARPRTLAILITRDCAKRVTKAGHSLKGAALDWAALAVARLEGVAVQRRKGRPLRGLPEGIYLRCQPLFGRKCRSVDEPLDVGEREQIEPGHLSFSCLLAIVTLRPVARSQW